MIRVTHILPSGYRQHEAIFGFRVSRPAPGSSHGYAFGPPSWISPLGARNTVSGFSITG
jgi:hypothetical protein